MENNTLGKCLPPTMNIIKSFLFSLGKTSNIDWLLFFLIKRGKFRNASPRDQHTTDSTALSPSRVEWSVRVWVTYVKSTRLMSCSGVMSVRSFHTGFFRGKYFHHFYEIFSPPLSCPWGPTDCWQSPPLPSPWLLSLGPATSSDPHCWPGRARLPC